MKFVDSFRFVSSSLSSLVDNLSERLHIGKCMDCKSWLYGFQGWSINL